MSGTNPVDLLTQAVDSETSEGRVGYLVAAIAGESARQLAFTTNSLLASERQRALGMADALVSLYNAIAGLPDTVRTVALQRALIRATVAYSHACDGLDGRWYEIPGGDA